MSDPGAVAQASNVMRAQNALQLALEIAEVAVTLAERAGAPPTQLLTLRQQVAALRAPPA